MLKTAVIIAGGASTRLRPLTDDKPKTLIAVRGQPILYWTLKWLRKHGIENVVIGVAYKKEQIYDYIAKNDFGLDIKFSEHTVEGGTAQAFQLAIRRHVKDENFIAMNGDELTNLEISRLWDVHKKNNAIVTLALAPFYCRFSVVEFNKEGRITGFERNKLLNNAPVHTGINVFNRKILDLIPDTPGNIEESVFKKLAEDKREIFSYMLRKGEGWMSINTQKDLEEANTYITEWLQNK